MHFRLEHPISTNVSENAKLDGSRLEAAVAIPVLPTECLLHLSAVKCLKKARNKEREPR